MALAKGHSSMQEVKQVLHKRPGLLAKIKAWHENLDIQLVVVIRLALSHDPFTKVWQVKMQAWSKCGNFRLSDSRVDCVACGWLSSSERMPAVGNVLTGGWHPPTGDCSGGARSSQEARRLQPAWGPTMEWPENMPFFLDFYKVTRVTNKRRKGLKIGKNCIKFLLLPKGQKSFCRSPMQELEEGLRSGHTFWWFLFRN